MRVGKRSTENGAIDEEYRVEYAVDRAITVGTGFLAMTVGCARCHDHKYDPIPTKDFYSLTEFFHSTDEPGFYAPGRSGITPGPTMLWIDAAAEKEILERAGRKLSKNGCRVIYRALRKDRAFHAFDGAWWVVRADADPSAQEHAAPLNESRGGFFI